MERIQKSLMAALIASEMSHIFCCVLPTVFSVLSLLAGLGLVGAMPEFFVHIHDFMHDKEIPMIVISGIVLAFGWWIYFMSRKMDCHSTGCGHGPCTPRKTRAHGVLKIASVLFVANVLIFAVVHRDALGIMPQAAPEQAQEQEQGAHDSHGHHDHHGHDH